MRLSLVLRGIVSLRLLQRKRGVGRLPVCEVLIATPTVRELVRQAHTEQLPEVLRDIHQTRDVFA